MARHDMQDQDTDWRTPDIDAGQRIAAADLERIAAKLEKAELADDWAWPIDSTLSELPIPEPGRMRLNSLS